MEKKVFQFTSMDFGKINEGKTIEVKPGSDFDIDSYGTMFCHHVESDEGRFVYTRVDGDFDMQVRIESIHNDNDSLTHAAIMARKDLDPKSILVSAAVGNWENTSGGIPYEYMIRIKHGGCTNHSKDDFHGKGGYGNEGAVLYGMDGCARSDLFPRTFPYVWLRLKRTGNVYAAYFKEQRSPNEAWTLLQNWEIDLGAQPNIGMAVIANHHMRDKWDLDEMRRTRAQVKYRDLVISN